MSDHMAIFMPKGPTKIRITMNLKNPTYAQHACFQTISNALYDDEDKIIAEIIQHMTDLGLTKLVYKGLPHASTAVHKAMCRAGYLHPRQDMLISLKEDCIVLTPSPYPNDLAWEDDMKITIDRVMSEEKILTNERQADVVTDELRGIADMLRYQLVPVHKSTLLPDSPMFGCPDENSIYAILKEAGISGEEYMASPELCQSIETLVTRTAVIHDVSVAVPMFDKAPCTRNEDGVWHINVSNIIGNLEVIRVDEMSLLKYFHRYAPSLRLHCMRQDVLAVIDRRKEK